MIRVLRLAFCPQAPHLASIYLAQINFARVRPALQKRDSRQRGKREGVNEGIGGLSQSLAGFLQLGSDSCLVWFGRTCLLR